MATRWDPSSTDYTTQMLLGGPGPAVGGQVTGQGIFTDAHVQQMKDMGVTMGDLQSLGLLGPPSAQLSSQNYTSGGQAGVQQPQSQLTNEGRQSLQNATMLKLMLAARGSQQQAQPQPPTWNQVGQAAGLSPADISQFQTVNRTPADIAQRFGVLGPQSVGLSPQQFQFQVPQQVVPTPVTGQPVVPAAQPVKRFQTGGLVTGNWDWLKVGQAAGLAQPDITTLQQQGLTPDQAAQRFGLGASPPQPVSQGQPTSQGARSTGSTTSQLMKSGGATGGQTTPTDPELFSNPMYGMNALGAAALQMPMVVNPQPSGQPSAKSGVADVPKPIVSQGAPIVPGQQASWGQVAQASGLSSNDIAELQGTGLSPADAARKFGLSLTIPQPQQALAGPWSTQPGVFVKAATPTPAATTPLQAAVQPTATAYTPTATPFATPPAAPGMPAPMQMPLPVLAAHTSGLADAGRALFAHFGGDPNSASPADIVNFHTQLTGAIGSLPARPLAAAPQPTAAKKMRSGGLVPGRGNEDTVPALLTPGEYVIPKDQVAQVFGGRTPVRMAGGGFPPDDDRNAPPEARRQTLTTPASQPTTPTQPTSSSTSSAQSSAPPAAPGGGYNALTTGLTQAAQAYSNSVSGRSTPYYSPGQNVWIGSSPGAGQSGFAYGSQAAAAADPGATGKGAIGMGGMSQGLRSGLGGIGSALTQASQDIAASVKPWQMQQSAIPAPPPAPPAPQLTQPQVAQQAPQGTNPYTAYATNQALYPTSPYYR